jgi:hypothetical protein
MLSTINIERYSKKINDLLETKKIEIEKELQKIANNEKLTPFEKQLQHDSTILHYQWQLEKAIKVIENQRFDIILK